LEIRRVNSPSKFRNQSPLKKSLTMVNAFDYRTRGEVEKVKDNIWTELHVKGK
jgi:hypothetical protein